MRDTSIKTVFLRLMAEGFIDILPQRGSYISLLDMDFINETIFMRYATEKEIINSAIDNITDDLLMELNSILTKQHNLINSTFFRPEDFYELDSQFHVAIYRSVGRERLWTIFSDFQVYYTRFRMLDLIATNCLVQLYQEHLAIFADIAAKDKAKLAIDLEKHLYGNTRRLSQKIKLDYRDYFVEESM